METEEVVIEVTEEPSDIEDEIVNYKVYKEEPYFNSAKEPFGITLKGKTKEYLLAHQALKQILVKRKKIGGEVKMMKFVEVTKGTAMVNAIIEVTDNGEVKGNAELKVHNPSLKKKGATLELRKMSGFDYECVLILKAMITNILDGVIAGRDITEVLKELSRNSQNQKNIGKISCKPRRFCCEICNFETKFSSALKSHITRIHTNAAGPTKCFKCSTCNFESNSITSLNNHVKTHKGLKRSNAIFKCTVCASSFDTEERLAEHEHNQHPKSNQSLDFCKQGSVSSSPPRKKIELEETDTSEVEMLDLELEADSFVHRLLENRIKELEIQVQTLEKKKRIDELIKRKLEEEITNLKSNPEAPKVFNVPEHLSSVRKHHLPFLHGYKMIYKAEPNGACLTNSFAVHAYEDPMEGARVKKHINNHIADNMEHYKQRIPLPYIEVIGGGGGTVTITTYEEMIEFLRSDKALNVFSNSHELLAISNLYNIKINIFTYNSQESYWSQVCPDPEFASSGVSSWIPDMSVYHNDNIHYDLLVKDDSRIALVGLVAGKENLSQKEVNKDASKEIFQWKDVPSSNNKKKVRIQTPEEEQVLVEDVHEDLDNGKDKLVEEMTLINSKNSGFRRTTPNQEPEKVQTQASYNCSKCGALFQSNGLLTAHMTTHAPTQFDCDICDESFQNESQAEKHTLDKHEASKVICDYCSEIFRSQPDLEEHIKSNHVTEMNNEWNCYDCPYQANVAAHLMNHLKLTSHQPSPAIKNRKALFLEYKQCYTCKQEFDGYRNLMNHRKVNHPSTRKCRDFPQNCKWGTECWYVNNEDRNIGKISQKDDVIKDSLFKCNICEKEFESKSSFMKHRKVMHEETVSQCEQNKTGSCKREDQECWFIHHSSRSQVFHKEQPEQVPPDQLKSLMDMVINLQQKMEQTQDQILKINKNLTNLSIM